MQIFVNGETQEIPSKCTVFQLLEDNAVSLKAAIVELNGKILKQEDWQCTVLQVDDKLEILIFMGGG